MRQQQNNITEEKILKAKDVVAYYTLAAAATGAVPIPATSAIIITENAAMLTHIAKVLGTTITGQNIVESMGVAGSINVAGRTLFIEGAKLLSWGTGGFWASALLSGLGASTAGLQTYIIGRIAIEIGKNDGKSLTSSSTSTIIEEAKKTYKVFVEESKKKNLENPNDSQESDDHK